MLAPGPSAPPNRIRTFVPAVLSDRLVRNGMFLTMSTVITSAFGIAFWTIAAREYSPEVLGRNSAAISAMVFLAGIAQLNLMSALVRFLPLAGRSTAKLVTVVYASSIGVSLGLSVSFLALLRWVAPGLRPLLDNGHMGIGFVVATMAWSIFALQDSVLTGIRKTWGVPTENTLYSVAKMALLVVLVRPLPSSGIFVAWSLGLVVSVIPVNLFLAIRAIPSHARSGAAGAEPPSAQEILRFAAPDYVGGLAWLAATYFLPVIVIDIAGARANAYYSLTWVMAYSLYLVATNMGISMVVETATSPARLAARCRQVVGQSMALVLPAAGVLVVAASPILSLFGHGYSTHASGLMRLLALSAIPSVIVSTGVYALRAQSKTVQSTAMLVGLCVAVFAVSVALMPVIGIIAPGVAWLASASAAAITFLAVPGLWPREGAHGRVASPSERVEETTGTISSTLGAARRRWRYGSPHDLDASLPAILAKIPTIDGAPDPSGWTDRVHVPTLSGLSVATVAPPGAEPMAVVKAGSGVQVEGELCSHVSVVELLAAEERLGSWRRFLPRFLSADFDHQPATVVEAYVPSVDGCGVLRAPGTVAGRALASSLDAISELHGRTAQTVQVDDAVMAEWIDRPLGQIAALYDSDSWQAGAARSLGDRFRSTLDGARVEAGWAHGDFSPGNLLLDPGSGELVAIADWGGASPCELQVLDPGILALTVAMIRTRRELGSVVIDVLRNPQAWSGWFPMQYSWPGAGVQDVALYCWLRHVAGNLRKASFYSKRILWRTVNLDAVLKEATKQMKSTERGGLPTREVVA